MKNWALWVWEQPTDFLIWNTENLPKLELQDDKRYEYNQGSSNDCTLYSSFGSLSDLMNYEFSPQEIIEMNELSYSRGRKRGQGWFTANWVKCVCDYWNGKYPTRPVAYYQIPLVGDITTEAIEKNYSVVVTYRGNSNYTIDYLTDWELNKDSFGTPTYWHATTLINWKKIKDSYKWRLGKNYIPCNIYDIKSELKNLVDNGVYYANAYLIVKIENEARLEELKRLNKFKQLVEQNIANNSEMWFTTNDKEFKDRLHSVNNELRNKLSDIQAEFDKIW